MLLKRTVLGAIVAIVVLSGLLTGCNSGPVVTGPTTPAQALTWYQQVASQFLAILPDEVPSNLIPADGLKNGKEFDVNTIFTILTHISMQEGYVLDYVYLSDGTQGGPILYIRPIDSTPFKTYEEYKQATHDAPRQTGDSSMIWLVKGASTSTFGNKITTDGSAEGYYEYALFQMLFKDTISKADRERLKLASRDLLTALRAHLRPMPNWTKNTQTQADVKMFILDNLYASLPRPPFSEEDTESLAGRVYGFVWQRTSAGALFTAAA